MGYNKESEFRIFKNIGGYRVGEMGNEGTVAARKSVAGGALFIYASLELIIGRWCESEVI